MNIKEFDFTKKTFQQKEFVKNRFTKGENWPVVYIIENGKSAYIGQTNRYRRRMEQHLKDIKKSKLTKSHCIYDKSFNKSAILDIEAKLISYFDADKQFTLLNGNNGVISQDYYDRKKYVSQIPDIWERLQKIGLADKEIFEIENSDLFKYSPMKSLSVDQFVISQMIIKDCVNQDSSISFVEGSPGTGKTVLAMYLLKILLNVKKFDKKKIAIVVAMDSLRETLGNVLKEIPGMNKYNVIGPFEAANMTIKNNNQPYYDVLIIDESHRLKRRVNLSSPSELKLFATYNEQLGLHRTEGTQLDWIQKATKHMIFFYDENQSIKPTDVRSEDFREFKLKHTNDNTVYTLYNQHRVKGGETYLRMIDDFFSNKDSEETEFEEYVVNVYESIEDFDTSYNQLKSKEKLVRMVSGYSFKWISKENHNLKDIVIGSKSYMWNSTSKDWINSNNAENEVGCIHTVQGYDLNHIYLIFGYEIDYDLDDNRFIVNRDKYYDSNGKDTVKSDAELLEYIINIYKTLMTRGIKGIHMYACNEGLRTYLERYFR